MHMERMGNILISAIPLLGILGIGVAIIEGLIPFLIRLYRKGERRREVRCLLKN